MQLARRVTGAVTLLCLLTGCGASGALPEKPTQQLALGPTSHVELTRKGDLWSLQLSAVQLGSVLGGGHPALKPGTTYVLLQPTGTVTTAAISKLLGMPPKGDSIMIDAAQYLTIVQQQVVGYVHVVTDGSNQQLQRWLLLNTYQNASMAPTILKPATKMDPVPSGGPDLPPNVGEFINRARTLFEAAKSGAADPCADHTRYVKARARVKRITGEPNPIQQYFPNPSDLLDYPDPPEPVPDSCPPSVAPGVQLDPGTIGLRVQATGQLVGVVDEKVIGDTGGALWLLSPSYVDPADPTSPGNLLISNLSGVTDVDLAGLSTSAGGTQRTWNVILESCRYHRKTFPATP